MKHFLFFLLSVVIISSCSKNAANIPDMPNIPDTTNTPDTTNIPDTANIPDTSFIPNTGYLVKQLVVDYNDGYHIEYSFSYDNLNRISQIHSNINDIDFEYSDFLIKKNVYSAGAPEEHYFYYYNTNSLLDSSVSVMDTSSLHVKYNYGSEGQVVQRVEKNISNNGDTMQTFVYSYAYNAKGNVVGIGREFVGATDSFLISGDTFKYSDTVNFTTSADMMYPDKVSRSNHNLLKEEIHENYWAGSALSYHYLYTYEFDDQKRIKIITLYNMYWYSPDITKAITYTYSY